MKRLKMLLKKSILTIIAFVAISTTLQAQDTQLDKNKRDTISVGTGLGYDYAGIGIGVVIYPQKNIGFFANAGIFIAGPSYTVGLKGRYITKSKVDPYITFQYGYSGCVIVSKKNEYTGIKIDQDKDKIFTRPNIGAGIDIHFTKNFCLTTGLTTNFAMSDIRDYMDELEDDHVADFSESIILPFGISFGLSWRLH